MKLSKRQFLKLGVSGAAVWALAPLLKPASLLASPVVIPPSYPDSAVHGYWMRLSHNGGKESREVRRILGAALRNIGAIKGAGSGFAFTLTFDRAVEAAFVRWANSRQKPGSLFGLIQMLHNDSIYPELGPQGGRAMYCTLLGMLRGLDGTQRGTEVHQAYLAYRALALQFKNAAKAAQDPSVVEQLRQDRKAALENWRTQLLMQVEDYARKRLELNPQFLVKIDMLDGFRTYVNPKHKGPARLKMKKAGHQMAVDWRGNGLLEEAPTASGPWTRTRKAPPVAIETKAPAKFFRTIMKSEGPQ